MSLAASHTIAFDRQSATGTAVLTVVSNNYLHFARTMLKSVKRTHPDADLFCVIVDTNLEHADALSQEFEVIRLQDLELPLGDRFFFQYNVLELNTAVKPWALAYLLNRGYANVIYIDPDIRLYRGMTEVIDGLNNGADIIVTPHLLAPINDQHRPSELDIRRAGTYNFGFCAVRNSDNTANFVDWWQSKLTHDCVVAIEAGIFVDQSWIDLVPGLFENVQVLRHPGYNVAYWNIAQREVRVDRDSWTVNGAPLVFFHYSGLDPLNPAPFSKHQDRFTLETLGPAKQLVKAYAQELLDNGVKRYSPIPYGFDLFDDGTRVPPFFHKLYRENEALRAALGDAPYAHPSILLETARTVEGEEITWAMLALWSADGDVQTAFPIDTADGVRTWRAWFVHDGAKHFSETVIRHHRAAIANPRPSSATSSTEAMTSAAASPSSHQRDDVDRIRAVFYVILGRFPDPGAVTTYCRILRKPNGRFRMWKAVAMSRENRSKLGWRARAWAGLRIALTDNLANRGDWPPVRANPPARIAAKSPARSADAPVAPSEAPARGVPDASSSAEKRWYDHRIERLRSVPSPYWLHEAEQDSRETGYWTTATIRLPLPDTLAGRTVCIEGGYNGELVSRQTGETQGQFAVFLRDRLLYLGEAAGITDFTFAFKLPETLGSRPQLTILSKGSFIPSEIGLADDDRELALKLKKVSVDRTDIFDCARENPVLVLDDDTVSVPGINLIGYIKAELGIGEAARSFGAAARSAEIPYSIIDMGFQTASRQTDEAAIASAVAAKQPIDILYVNADQTRSTINHLRRIDHDATVRIGVWHWEQPLLPERFLGSFAGLNEVWVPTSFVQQAVASIAPIPVVKIPNAVEFVVPSAPRRARFGLPARAFLVLMMYDFHSYQYRKNPDAAIAAFRRAAAERSDTVLVIKTLNASHHQADYDALKLAIADLRNVVYIDQPLARADVYELQACCDALLSLHRAEGFGLAPAEMMFLGKPVIATGWSGNMDFMTQMNSYPVDYTLEPLTRAHGPYQIGQLWAEADIDHASWCLKQAIEGGDAVERKRQLAAADIRANHSFTAVGRQIRARLNLLADQHDIG